MIITQTLINNFPSHILPYTLYSIYAAENYLHREGEKFTLSVSPRLEWFDVESGKYVKTYISTIRRELRERCGVSRLTIDRHISPHMEETLEFETYADLKDAAIEAVIDTLEAEDREYDFKCRVLRVWFYWYYNCMLFKKFNISKHQAMAVLKLTESTLTECLRWLIEHQWIHIASRAVAKKLATVYVVSAWSVPNAQLDKFQKDELWWSRPITANNADLRKLR